MQKDVAAKMTMDADFTETAAERCSDSAARRDRALAIKACLENLRTDARMFALRDLERFIELAALAADEAATELAAVGTPEGLRYARPLGEC